MYQCLVNMISNWKMLQLGRRQIVTSSSIFTRLPKLCSYCNAFHSPQSRKLSYFSSHQNPFSPCLLMVSQTDYTTTKRAFSVTSSQHGITDLLRAFAASQPVVAAQDTLVAIHDMSALPWWGTILLTTATARCLVTFPLGLYQVAVLAKLESLKPGMDKLAQDIAREVKTAKNMYKWDERTARQAFNRAIRKQRAELIAQNNCHPLKAGLVFWFQFPFWIGLSMALRNLAWALPVGDAAAQVVQLQLSVGGCLWFSNLAAPDPTFLLPALFAVVNLCVIQVGVLSQTKTTSAQRGITWLFRGLTVIMTPVAALLPSGVVFYWTVSSFCGLLANLALKSPRIRRLVRISQTSQEQQHPYRHIWETLVSRLRKR